MSHQIQKFIKKNVSNYFDVTHFNVQLAPIFISKVNTAVQLITLSVSLGAPVWNYIDHPIVKGLCYLTGMTTMISAACYMAKKDTNHEFIRHEIKKIE